jgi:cobalamin biosynthesis Co2+ chelatase CbiK
MCLTADEVNPLCDDCFGKYKEAREKGIELKDEDMCDECRDLPNHYCFCCNTVQRQL